MSPENLPQTPIQEQARLYLGSELGITPEKAEELIRQVDEIHELIAIGKQEYPTVEPDMLALFSAYPEIQNLVNNMDEDSLDVAIQEKIDQDPAVTGILRSLNDNRGIPIKGRRTPNAVARMRFFRVRAALYAIYLDEQPESNDETDQATA